MELNGDHVETELSSENELESAELVKKSPKTSVLNHYAALSHIKPNLRLKSASCIIQNLITKSEPENSDELHHAISRLVRGLGASKLSSRIGYFTTLSVLLESIPADQYAFDDIRKVIEKELHTSGNNAKSENADILSGLILACGALLRSGKFPILTPDNQKFIVDHLQNVGSKRSYLGLLASEMFTDSLQKFDETAILSIMNYLQPYMTLPLTQYTLHNFYLLIKLQTLHPNIISAKYLKNTIGTSKILHKSHHKTIVPLIMHVHLSKNASKHPIYALFARELSKQDALIISDFIQHLDTDLTTPTLSKHVLHTVFLQHLISSLPNGNLLTLCISETFIQKSIEHFRRISKHRQSDPLIISLRSLFNNIVLCSQRTEVTSITKLHLIQKLLFEGPGSSFIFEKITGFKLIQQLTASLDAEGARNLSTLYADVLQTSNNRYVNADRVYAAQMLAKLLTHPSLRSEAQNAWKNEQLQMLLHLSCMQTSRVSSELANRVKETFFSVLDARVPKLQDLRARLSFLLRYVDANMQNLRNLMDEEQTELWIKTLHVVRKLESSDKRTTPVFHTLFAYMALQMLNEAKLAGDALRELHACYARRRKTDVDDVPWVQVVLDLFLHLLSQDTRAMRSIIVCVFPHLCPKLTDEGVDQILHVLDPSVSNPLLDQEEGDEEESEDDDSEEEESDEGEAQDDTVLDQLRLALQGALTADGESDGGSVDMDDMDEEQAENLNASLGAAFARFRPSSERKHKQERTEAALTRFRVRVMDLVDIYLESDLTIASSIKLIRPLLSLMQFSVRDVHQKPLQMRVQHALTKLTSIRHFKSGETLQMSELVHTLEEILSKGEKSALMMADLAQSVSECCLFIIHVSGKLIEEKSSEGLSIIDVVLKHLEEFITKRDCLTPFVFFKKLMDSSWESKGMLIAPLFRVVFNEGVRKFRRRQAVDLLQIFYSNRRAFMLHAAVYAAAISSSEEDFIGEVNAFLVKKEYHLRDAALANLFTLLATIKRVNLLAYNDKAVWSEMAKFVKVYRAGVVLSKDSKTAYNKLCAELKVSPIVDMESHPVRLNSLAMNGHHVDEEDDENEGKGETKTKQSRIAKRMKKEAGGLRMATLSEGMLRMSFTNSQFPDSMDVEDHVVDDDQKEKKVKKADKKRKKSLKESETETVTTNVKMNGQSKRKKK